MDRATVQPRAEPARTDDGRYIIVNGRRWRASDPGLPERLRQALVDSLMAARRSVKAAAGDESALRAAREQVQAAKVALGERGPKWWDRSDADEGRSIRLAAARAALAEDVESLVLAERYFGSS